MPGERSRTSDAVWSAGLVLAIDQLMKGAIRASMPICPDGPIAACERIALVGPVGILRTENPASALGLLGAEWVGLLLLTTLALLTIQVGVGQRSWTIGLAVGLQLGGWAANLLDRLWFGSVTDFIHVEIGPAGQGVILNPADIGLAIGGLLLAAGSQRTRLPRFSRMRGSGLWAQFGPASSRRMHRLGRPPGV